MCIKSDHFQIKSSKIASCKGNNHLVIASRFYSKKKKLQLCYWIKIIVKTFIHDLWKIELSKFDDELAFMVKRTQVFFLGYYQWLTVGSLYSKQKIDSWIDCPLGFNPIPNFVNQGVWRHMLYNKQSNTHVTW